MPGSSRGYHYISEFRECPRRFYFHSVVGLEPRKKRPALLFGSAVHETVDFYHKNQSLEAAIEHGLNWLREQQEAFEHEDNLLDCQTRLPPVIRKWHEIIAKDDEKYDTIASEVELEGEILGILKVTGRIDSIKIHKESGVLYINDIKTTSYSMGAALETLQTSDQMTMYSWLVSISPEYKTYPFGGGLVDVVYSRGKVVEVQREPFYRDQNTTIEFVCGLQKTVIDMLDFKKAVVESETPGAVAYRNPSSCDYCSFKALCVGSTLKPVSHFEEPPTGFVKVTDGLA